MIQSRRAFMASLLSTGALVLPRPARGAPQTSSQRKFLFVFAAGGWDPTFVFAPMFDSSNIYTDPGAQTATAGGLTYVSNTTRSSVDDFFAAYGDRCCIVNGLEVPSITHERCRSLLLTGNAGVTGDDWPSIIAATSDGFTLPHLVLSGPSYTSQFTSSVMRLGENGQLGALADGTALLQSDLPVDVPTDDAAALIDAFVAARREAFVSAATTGHARRYADALTLSAQQVELLGSFGGDIDLGIDQGGWVYASDRVSAALTCMERGYTRCAIVEQAGEWDVTWDSHADLTGQDRHFRTLFDDLNAIMSDLEGRTTPSGAALADELTIVVFSEMGRTPALNSSQGKDHWTYTSALLIGAGVRGGQVVGAFDDQLLGRPVDLTSGAATDSGTALSAEHLGATLLALADVDPGDWITSAQPIDAVLA